MSEPLTEEELSVLAEKRRAEQAKEYGQYVAAQDIVFNGVPAYQKGSAVPASNVERYGYLTHGLVITAEQATKEREAAAEAARAEAEAAAEAHRAEVAEHVRAQIAAANQPEPEPAPAKKPSK